MANFKWHDYPQSQQVGFFDRAIVVIDRSGNRNLYVPTGPDQLIGPLLTVLSGVCNTFNSPPLNSFYPLFDNGSSLSNDDSNALISWGFWEISGTKTGTW